MCHDSCHDLQECMLRYAMLCYATAQEADGGARFDGFVEAVRRDRDFFDSPRAYAPEGYSESTPKPAEVGHSIA